MGCNCEGKTINVGMGCCQPVLGPVENYYTKQQVDKLISAVTVSAVSEAWVEDYAYDKATVEEKVDTLNTKIERVNNRFDNYYTTAETSSSTEIADALTAVNDQIVSATSGMATQEWVENQGYLTEHQSLSGYATEQWVEDQGYLTEHQSLSGYATEQWVLDKNYITGVDLSNYALKSEIPTVPTSNTAFTNDAGYITSTALNGYATEAYVSGYTYGKAAVDNKLADKLDATAYTPTDLSNYYTKNETSSKTEIADALAEKLAVSDFQTYSGTVASELSRKASQSTVDTLSGQIQSISSSTSGDVTVISGDVITISGDVTSLSNDLSVHTANTTMHVTTSQTASWDAKQNALTAGSGISIANNVISVTGGTEGISSAQCQTQIDQSISGKTNQSDFSAHTANTTVHVTTSQTASWDAKSDFSGSYNDLTNKPTIPSIWSGTEAQWSQISGGTLDNNTIYLVY